MKRLPLILLLAACRSAPAPTPVKPRPVNDADQAFMQGMIHHHAQAILIAGWAPSHNAGDAVKRLAERIVVAQRDEINLMTMWLKDRGLEPMNHEMMMPGMLTAEQLQQLDAARGADFDKLFLTFMIQHHKGALTMVETLLHSFGAAQDETVFRFSSDVVADQSTEIDRMETMLTQMESSRDK